MKAKGPMSEEKRAYKVVPLGCLPRLQSCRFQEMENDTCICKKISFQTDARYWTI